MPDECVVVLSTLPVDADGSGIARTLVEERLAACVNLLPAMASTYRWKDSVQTDPEHQVIIKTTRERLPALRMRLKELHPYDVPEFIVLPVLDGSDAYLNWIRDSVGEG